MSIFDFGPLMIGNAAGARAIGQDELAAMAIANARFAVNAERNADYHNALHNYRPPIHVPAGWVEWYDIGDDLH